MHLFFNPEKHDRFWVFRLLQKGNGKNTVCFVQNFSCKK